MGNRALIVQKGASVGIYLQWNGGRDSVEAFLKYAELSKVPPLNKDLAGIPSFLTIITNFFGNDGLNVYLEEVNPHNLEKSHPGDNGIYVVDGFTIIERYFDGVYQNEYKLEDLLEVIDAAQPEKYRLGTEFIQASEVPTKELKVGSKVFLLNRLMHRSNESGRYKVYTVQGFNSEGAPYVDMYENEKNPNSYIRSETVRVFKKSTLRV